jgi:UDP-N-acetylmuramate--alanine ligase
MSKKIVTGAGQPAYSREVMRRVRRIHMVGIGGSGMSGIAVVLHGLDYEISGSDVSESPVLDDLRALGIEIHMGHKSHYVEGADVVVASNAIAEENPELKHARSLLIPVVPRAEMLAEIMRFRHGIAVSGTHGKTTTTSMIVAAMAAHNPDFSYVIGGRINSADRGANLGQGSYFVVEADESDASFLHLQPMCTVLTNLEADHLENYQGDFNLLREAYINFLHNLPFYGLAILCFDDPVLRDLVEPARRQIRSYGFYDDADYRISDFKQRGFGASFTVHRPNAEPLPLQINVPGRHNACNAAAAVAVASEYEIPDQAVQTGLRSFFGVERRFQVEQWRSPEGEALTLIDDYGHHPTEMQIAIDMARALYPKRRLFMIFQPHRYSRLADLYERFVKVLAAVDFLLVLGVYAAGERQIAGMSSDALCRSVRQLHKVDPLCVVDNKEAHESAMSLMEEGDVLLIQGAGSIGDLKPMIKDSLQARHYTLVPKEQKPE